MTIDERDAIGSAIISLEKAGRMAEEINAGFFIWANPKEKKFEILNSYPNYQTFSFILLDYLDMTKKALDEITAMFDNQQNKAAKTQVQMIREDQTA